MSEADTELLAAVARVVAAFEALDVDYLVGGSVASSFFGEPRQTVDADLVARLLGRHAEPLVARLSGDFYADLPAIVTAIQTQGCFNLIHLETMTKVDVFVHWRDPFGQSQFARRQKKSVGQAAPLELFFATAEDTVLAKLDWYRKGGGVSDRQWRDLLAVLKVQAGALDRAYLVHWAGELGVTDLLRRALDEAGLTESGIG
ncbi:MAG: hypothetical protein HY298_01610 [Verrucomicrobia bacterium]|nr:hypothetical protein [Verrucomicrobiota bacterium]